MNSPCEYCDRDAGVYDKTRRCCNVRLVANMPKERRQDYYKQVERVQGRTAVNELIAEVNAVLQVKREAKLKGGKQ